MTQWSTGELVELDHLRASLWATAAERSGNPGNKDALPAILEQMASRHDVNGSRSVGVGGSSPLATPRTGASYNTDKGNGFRPWTTAEAAWIRGSNMTPGAGFNFSHASSDHIPYPIPTRVARQSQRESENVRLDLA